MNNIIQTSKFSPNSRKAHGTYGIITQTNLFDALVEYKKMKGYRHLNYYGTTDAKSIILSTVGIEEPKKLEEKKEGFLVQN